jgi:hypothetical protein
VASESDDRGGDRATGTDGSAEGGAEAVGTVRFDDGSGSAPTADDRAGEGDEKAAGDEFVAGVPDDERRPQA